jgi:hypothetical protein
MTTTVKIIVGAAVGVAAGFAVIAAITWIGNMIVRATL